MSNPTDLVRLSVEARAIGTQLSPVLATLKEWRVFSLGGGPNFKARVDPERMVIEFGELTDHHAGLFTGTDFVELIKDGVVVLRQEAKDNIATFPLSEFLEAGAQDAIIKFGIS